MKRQDVNAKRALRDVLITVRQLAENHRVSFTDISMAAADKYAQVHRQL